VFANLTDEECDVVAAACKPIIAPVGATVFREGATDTSLLIVVSGTLTVSAKTPVGTEQVLRKVGPGDVLGELAFFDSKPRSATLTANEGAALISFSRDAMRRLRRDSVRVTAAIHRGILKDLRHRLRDLAAKSGGGPKPSDIPMESSASLGPGASMTAVELSRLPGLARYSAEDFALLSEVCTIRSFEAGDRIMEQGKRGICCWLLLTGEVVASSKTLKEPIVTLGPGTLLGQLALLDGAVRSATVVARVASTAIEIRAAAFAKLLMGDSPLSLRMQEQVAIAGVTQARMATNKYTELAAEHGNLPPGSQRTTEWDPAGMDGLEIELDLKSIPNER